MLGKNLKKLSLSLLPFVLGFIALGCSSEKEATSSNNGKKAPVKATEPIAGNFELRSSHKKVQAIKWFSYDEGMKKAKLEKKYVFMDFYTDWCMYCKKLEAETYTDEKVFNYINNKFIPIKINAESQTKVSFNGKKVTEQELAQQFQVSSYPTIYFMSGEKEAIGQIPGFIDAEELYTVASYVASNAYKNKTLEQYKSAQKI